MRYNHLIDLDYYQDLIKEVKSRHKISADNFLYGTDSDGNFIFQEDHPTKHYYAKHYINEAQYLDTGEHIPAGLGNIPGMIIDYKYSVSIYGILVTEKEFVQDTNQNLEQYCSEGFNNREDVFEFIKRECENKPDSRYFGIKWIILDN